MTGLEKPLYLVTYLNVWVTHKALLDSDIAVPAFGTREAAERWLRADARETGHRLRDYQIHAFECSDALAVR